MFLPDDRGIAGQGAEDIAYLYRIFHRHYLKSVHQRFQRLQRVYLGNNDPRAQSLGAHGKSPAAPAITTYDDNLSGIKDVSGP